MSTCPTVGAVSAARCCSGSSRSPRTTAARWCSPTPSSPSTSARRHGYRQFAEACGYQLSNYEVVRHLPLPVPDERIQGWVDEAAPRHEGYTIETFVDEVPDDLVESLCVLLGQLAVDAPTGAVDFDEEADDARAVRRERRHGEGDGPGPLRDARAHARPAGRRAVDPRRAPVVGSTTVFQWGTFVHREHRGHALGLATKAVNLRAVQAARDDLTLVTTQNAETNGYMVSINERMGFQPVEVSDRVRQVPLTNRSSSPGRAWPHCHRSSGWTTASTG